MGGKEKNDTSDFTKVKSHQEVNEKTDGQSGDKAPALRTSRDVEGGEHGQSGDQATSALTVEGEKPIAIDPTAFHVGNIAEVVFETLPSITLNVINMTMLTRDGVAAVEWTNILSLCVSIYMIFRHGYKYSYWFAIKGMSFKDLPIPGTQNTTKSNSLAAAKGTRAVASAAKDMISALQ